MIVLRVSDDGTGFDEKSVVNGHGLTSMRERAEKLSGELAVNSRAGAGSEIILKAPVSRRAPRTSL
jgi:signal transduction histidine kinase